MDPGVVSSGKLNDLQEECVLGISIHLQVSKELVGLWFTGAE